MSCDTLVFAWGNRSRGDDALGPLLIEQLRELDAAESEFDVLEDFQLQPEHAIDLRGRRRVLFVDASVASAAPFEVNEVKAARDSSFTSHAMSPQSLLQVYKDLYQDEPPTCQVLAIRAANFELGDAPSRAALQNLDAALAWARTWLALPLEPVRG